VVKPAAHLLDGRQRVPGADRPLDQVADDRDGVLVVGGGEGQRAVGEVGFGLRVAWEVNPPRRRGRRFPSASAGSSGR